LSGFSVVGMVEIVPVRRSRGYDDIIQYDHVKSYLNVKTLREIIKSRIIYPKWKVEDLEGYFTYQYENKPKVYISKRDWRLYTKDNDEKSRTQAYNICRWLVKFGYIEGYRRRRNYLINR